MISIFIIIFISVAVLAGVIYTHSVRKNNELDLPTLDIKSLLKDAKGKTNVLFIFPHPDDEVVTSTGLLKKLSKNKSFNVSLVITTNGESGNEKLKLPKPELSKIRKTEFDNVTKFLGVNTKYMWNYEDSGMHLQIENIKAELRDFIKTNAVDLIITFEKYGWYGHKDHVILSKIINELKNENGNFKTLYVTLPSKGSHLRRKKHEYVGIEVEDFELNMKPEFKLPIYRYLFTKYLSALMYKSQVLSHKKPLWQKVLLAPYEYYTTKYEDDNL